MRYIDEYRQPDSVNALICQLNLQAEKLPYSASRPLRIMEVCGGHTHAIFKFGLDQLLPKNIEFIHGPGCPVCVLPKGRIDAAINIARQQNVIFCTFGDAMRVPGKSESLIIARSQGCDIRMVYSPLDALQLAEQHPHKQVVFFALGFETTMPATAVTLQTARARNLSNFFIFCQHITLLPSLIHLLKQPDNTIDAFLMPGHVSMIIGATPYQFIVSDYQRPVVIGGFEPVDILQSISLLAAQKITGQYRVVNQYKRVVPDAGNCNAQQALDEVFRLQGDGEWRGLGMIEEANVTLTDAYAQFDAEQHFNLPEQQVADDPDACCGEVLIGHCKPWQCPLFANGCDPQNACGALMVSPEGACAAWYKYRRQEVTYEYH